MNIKEIKQMLIETFNTLNVKMKQGTACLNFGINHLIINSLIAIMVFAISFAIMGFNRSDVLAASENETLATYNEQAISVNYGDDEQVAQIAQEILSNKVSKAEAVKVVTLKDGSDAYSLGDYVIIVASKQDQGNVTYITLGIETAATAASESSKLIVADNNADNNIEAGSIHNYVIKVVYEDTQAPLIKLKKNSVEINADDNFDANAYVASISDNHDQNLVDYQVSGKIAKNSDGYVAGTYALTYTAADAAGNVGSATLTVKVKEVAKADTTSTNEVTSTADTETTTTAYATAADSPYAGSIVAQARSLIGSPYVYGAAGPYAFDCSGFVQFVYSKAGIAIPRTSGAQAGVGVAIDPNNMSAWRAGDIVVYANHAAIYSGGGTLIHALNPALGVLETGMECGAGPVIAVRRVQ